MDLASYLDKTGETQAAFARRAGLLEQTVSAILRGGGTRTDTAAAIVEATGGLVSFMELRSKKARSGRRKTG